MTWWAIHYSSGRIEINNNSYSTPLATVSILCAPYVHEHINWTKLLDKCQQHCRTGVANKTDVWKLLICVPVQSEDRMCLNFLIVLHSS